MFTMRALTGKTLCSIIISIRLNFLPVLLQALIISSSLSLHAVLKLLHATYTTNTQLISRPKLPESRALEADK